MTTEHSCPPDGAAGAAEVLDVRIRSREVVADDVITLELVPIQGGELPPFEAGSHVDVYIRDGLVRQYSLCNDPAEHGRYVIAVLKEARSRGGSAAIHDDFRVGQSLRIGAPRNAFPLQGDASHSILFAGGIGITPILSMAHRLLATDAAFEMHYCVRSRSRAAFGELLSQGPLASHAQIHIDDEPDTRPFDPQVFIPQPLAGHHMYVCGPQGFIDAIRTRALDLGWSEDSFHSETFTAAAPEGDEFIVHAALSDVTVNVPSGQSIAQVLMDAGVDVLTSCEQGVCGACLTRVIEGIPEHRDAYQTREERAANTHMTVCCSRAKTKKIVLEI